MDTNNIYSINDKPFFSWAITQTKRYATNYLDIYSKSIQVR